MKVLANLEKVILLYGGFILLPFITQVFLKYGYTSNIVIAIEGILVFLSLLLYIVRYWKLSEYKDMVCNKEFYFQNISYVLIIFLDMILGFKIVEVNGVINYFVFHKLIFLVLMVYSVLLLISMIKTNKSIKTEYIVLQHEE